MRLDANQLQTTDNSRVPNWLLAWYPRRLLPTQIPHSRRSTQTPIHLPESVKFLEKRGGWRRRSGMIVKTVEIVEERRTGQASQPRLNHASLVGEAGAGEASGVGSTISGSGAHSERKMDGGRNRIVTRHERGAG